MAPGPIIRMFGNCSKMEGRPGLERIEPYLVNASDFSHMISMLILAERLKTWGHQVQIVSDGRHASPDLLVQAVGGKQNWLQIECYQPRPLSGKPLSLSLADAHKITKEAMKKARAQLGGETPGIMALCMYNQPRSNIDLLKKIVEARLRETSRSSLAGFILMCQNNLQTSQEGSLSFSPVITLDFLQNPAYFGVIEISSDVPKDSPGSLIGPAIEERLNEIIVSDFVLLQRAMQRMPEVQDSDLTLHPEVAVVPMKIEKLPILENPIRDRAIFSWSGDKYSVYFEGEGNIDFLCGNCGTTLARRIWKLSCNNIVVQCPTCGSYNEFLPQESSTYLKTSNVAIEAGDSSYRCSTTIVMKRGICLIGVEHDYHLRYHR